MRHLGSDWYIKDTKLDYQCIPFDSKKNNLIMKNNILIIGGYGKSVKQVTELLFRQRSKLKIALAGRNLEKAEKEARRIIEVLQLLDGSVRKPGLWFQSNLVEPRQFLKEIQKMGIDLSEGTRGNSRIKLSP